jgi:hypothetical protein
MTRLRPLICSGALTVLLVPSIIVVPLAGQERESAGAYEPHRTPWGDPDLQGIYDFQSDVPFQRPLDLGSKVRFASPEEKAEYQRRARASLAQAPRPAAPNVGSYGAEWTPRNVVPNLRTSLIQDPPDGRLPSMTPEALQKYRALTEHRRKHLNTYDTYQNVATYERCISRPMPRINQGYNSGTLIVQSPGWVAFLYEMLDTRIIPLDGRPHLDSSIRQWNGSSRGHWEGNTLVVDTVNLTDKQTGFPPADLLRGKEGPVTTGSPLGDDIPVGVLYDELGRSGYPQGNFHLTERYTPIDANIMNYEATIDDPTTWTKPFTYLMPWRREPNYQIYEYACHETNYGLRNALAGARYQDKVAAAAAKKKDKQVSK